MTHEDDPFDRELNSTKSHRSVIRNTVFIYLNLQLDCSFLSITIFIVLFYCSILLIHSFLLLSSIIFDSVPPYFYPSHNSSFLPPNFLFIHLSITYTSFSSDIIIIYPILPQLISFHLISFRPIPSHSILFHPIPSHYLPSHPSIISHLSIHLLVCSWINITGLPAVFPSHCHGNVQGSANLLGLKPGN